jgi:hypothetical protein
MSYRYFHAIAFLLLVSALLFSGCTSVRLADTHNTTLAVKSYNTWADAQNTYNRQVVAFLDQLNQHRTAYNSELTKEAPDIRVLRAGIAADHQILREWEAQSNELDAATERFSSGTAALDFSASPDSKEAVGVLTQDMKIYSLTMKNAEQHLVDYTSAIDSYLTPDDPDYWNDGRRVSAMNANSEAQKTIADGESARTAVFAAAKKLENSQ